MIFYSGTEIMLLRERYNRDLKNVVDTAVDEGKAEGIQEKALEAAKKFKDAGVSVETIALCTGLPVTIVEGL